MQIQFRPLLATEYAPYGVVIEAGPAGGTTGQTAKPANQGTAQRLDFLAELINLRDAQAKPNLCVFRCAPQITKLAPQFEIKLLEKHPYSTQVFIPMGGPAKYLVIVCLGNKDGSAPDLNTLRAFVAHGKQGITYHPGVWHHPMVAMDQETDFVCWVAENGTAEDTVIKAIPQTQGGVYIEITGSHLHLNPLSKM